MRTSYKFWLLLTAFAFTFTFQSCQRTDEFEDDLPAAEKRTHRYEAAVAQDWADLVMHMVKSEGKNPPTASRIYGYTGVTLYESCVPGMPRNRSLQGQLNGLNNLPKRNKNKMYDFREVANEALYIVVKDLFPNPKPENAVKLDSLHDAIADHIKSAVPSPIFNNSKTFGQAIGNAMKNWAAGDNYAQTRFLTYTVPSRSINPSFWEPTGTVLNPLEPFWGQIRPMALHSAAESFIPSLVPYSTVVGSPFYNQAMEVYQTRQNLTPEQANIALWWADGGGTITPPGHWCDIASKLIDDNHLDLARAAEVYALVGMATMDAFISCWEAKYRVNLLRPYTYIRENIDPAFTPLISTPPFPEYTSGHSTCSGASAYILTKYFGDNFAFTDETNVYLGFAPRSFSSFNEAAEEASMSRLYGGIHFREGNVNGLAQGRSVGQKIWSRVRLEK